MREILPMDTDVKDLVVRQSNKLIEASYRISSIGEFRLIRMLTAQISPSDEDFKTYRISVLDFAKFFGLSSGGNAYELIEESVKSLARKAIGFKDGKSWVYISCLSFARYVHGSGYVELRFDKALKPYLLQLKNHYTQYGLENITSFRSIYSMRVYEFLKSAHFTADKNGYFKKCFEYLEIREKLGIEDFEYKLFADFRVNVLERSKKEINANSDITILQIDYGKTGRKISNITFHCENKKQTRLDINEDPDPLLEVVKKPKEHPDYIQELIAIGIDEETAYRWKRKYSVARLRDSLAYTKAMQQAGRIKESLTGFLVNALTNNIASMWKEENKKKEEAKKEEARKKAIEEAKEEQRQIEERARREALFIEFLELPEQEKIQIRKAFEASLSPIILKIWNAAKRANHDSPESEGKIKTQFLIFYKDSKKS